MLRLLKALPLALVLAALIIFAAFAASCGSSSSQARFINAVPGISAVDIDFNGTKEFSSIEFATASGSTYVSVPSGSDTIEGLASGTTTEVFSSTASLNSGSQYTLVAVGFTTGTVNILNPVDNNTAPADGTVSFRVIHASPDGPGTVDIYILPSPINCNFGAGDCTKTISSLAYQSTSTYANQPWNSGGGGYLVYVTAAGSTTPIFNPVPFNAGSSSVGTIRTLVLTDNSSGKAMNTQPIVLDDLN